MSAAARTDRGAPGAGDRMSGQPPDVHTLREICPRTLMRWRTALAFGLVLAARLVHAAGIESAVVNGDGIRLEFDSRMRSRVVATFATGEALGPFEESETLLTAAGALGDFALESREEGPVTDPLGDGHRVTLTGHAGRIAKRVEVTAYAARPRWLFLRVRYTNEGERAGRDAWAGPAIATGSTASAGQPEPAFWSYQSGSYEKRPDWVLPLPRRLHAAELPRHERHRLRRRHADTRRVAARRRPRGGPRGARAEARFATGATAPGRQRGARGEREACHSPEARREPRHAAHFRGRASRRSLRHAARVQRGDAGAGREPPAGPQGRLRADLVRLGLRARLHAGAGVRDAAGRQAARLPLGGPRRRLAGGRGRLGSRREQVPRAATPT